MASDERKRETPEERTRRQREEVRQIAAMLQARVRDLAPILLPEGRLESRGREWRAGDRGGRSIVLTGPTAGVYRDFRGGDKGCDMLAAVAAILCNGSMRDAIAWARSYLGLADLDQQAYDLALKRAAERAAKKRIEDEKAAAELDAKRRRQAGGLWHSADPLECSPADDYLLGRGIDIRRLARPVSALRFNPKTWCQDRRGEFPAMVSALWRIGDPQLVATHRTYLSPRGEGWTKAEIEKPRSILGSWPGAVIPIQRGEAGTRWIDIAEGEEVAFGEGIEEGLSIALVRPRWRVGAVGFVGNFAQIKLPVWCHVMLCINNDPPGSQADKAIFGDPEKNLPGAVRVLEEAGHVVRVLRPPQDFKDWNDLLTGKRRGG
jgi:hypothetical protein